MKGEIVNNTNKNIVKSDIDGTLKLIFKEKTIEKKSNSSFKNTFASSIQKEIDKYIPTARTEGILEQISEQNPWKPNTSKHFYLQTEGLDDLYIEYLPPYAYFTISLTAEDPIGYTFDKDILEYDVKSKWELLPQNKK